MLDPSKVCVLNEPGGGGDGRGEGGSSGEENCPDPVELSKSLHKKILRLKGIHLSLDGSKVDYEKLREDPLFQDFVEETRLLSLVDLNQLSRSRKEQKAFFINIYNTLTVHALAHSVKDEATVLQLEKFWQMYVYRIGPFKFSLDDIEHGVLRGNKLHPTYKDYFFKKGDPRRAFVDPNLDPRIHFALNCGAKSCPPIRLFAGDNIDTGLDLAARSFCQTDVAIDVKQKRVKMTKILMWYASDFGADEKSIIEWVSRYLSEGQREELNMIMNDNPTIEYSDYDWKIV